MVQRLPRPATRAGCLRTPREPFHNLGQSNHGFDNRESWDVCRAEELDIGGRRATAPLQQLHTEAA
eukprot:38394-Eustigmatos_ZCMA.PRE.1